MLQHLRMTEEDSGRTFRRNVGTSTLYYRSFKTRNINILVIFTMTTWKPIQWCLDEVQWRNVAVDKVALQLSILRDPSSNFDTKANNAEWHTAMLSSAPPGKDHANASNWQRSLLDTLAEHCAKYRTASSLRCRQAENWTEWVNDVSPSSFSAWQFWCCCFTLLTWDKVEL
jgi:hypothetical protein